MASSGDIIEIELEDYIKGVVYSEMPSSFNIEALKAQSVATRTYTEYKLSKNINLCDNPAHCQGWYPPDNSKEYEKVSLAVNETKGEIMYYFNDVVQAFFHSSSGGKTESAENVWGKAIPYLVSLESPNEEKIMPTFFSQEEFTYKEFQQQINNHFNKKLILTSNLKNKIKIVSRTESGRVKEINIENTALSGTELRNILNLRSANFEIILNKDKITFNVKGYGHGVGLSQWGAEAMARDGKTYKEILQHYYPNTSLKSVAD